MNPTQNKSDFTLIQTIHPPFDDLGLIEAHHKLVSDNISWSDVGIFIDQDAGEQTAVLIILLEHDEIIAVFRICLATPGLTIDSIRLFVNNENTRIILRSCQGEFFTSNQIQSLESLNILWQRSKDQSVELSQENEFDLIEKIFFKPRDIGRGKDFSVETKRKVNMDAHGRCMFEGCGARLLIDETTGVEGNYGYLAHNVASAENGPRGIKGLSDELSDTPSNILLLCDKHHRLVDKIAAADYPATRLSKMRADFCTTASKLLDGLSYEPVPAIAIIWPIQRNVISPPSNLQINQSMAKMNWRMASELLSPCSNNDALLRNHDLDTFRGMWPQFIAKDTERIISCIGINQYRTALFAIGPMPQLIALGAKIGNKQEIIPMLRYRDGNQWIWPADASQGKNYEVLGMDKLDKNEDEIILTLSFTNHPERFDNYVSESKIKNVQVRANEFGNGAIGHPNDGINFMADMQCLMHRLKDQYGVKRIHILPCASNAVCVFFGKAFDIHHPELIVYDFKNETMEPILRILNKNHLCHIEAA